MKYNDLLNTIKTIHDNDDSSLHNNIVMLLKKHDVKLTENDYGYLVQCNQIPIHVLEEIHNLVSSSNKETCIEKVEDIFETPSETVPETIETIQQKPSIETWKLDILEKMRSEARNKMKKKKISKI